MSESLERAGETHAVFAFLVAEWNAPQLPHGGVREHLENPVNALGPSVFSGGVAWLPFGADKTPNSRLVARNARHSRHAPRLRLLFSPQTQLHGLTASIDQLSAHLIRRDISGRVGPRSRGMRSRAHVRSRRNQALGSDARCASHADWPRRLL